MKQFEFMKNLRLTRRKVAFRRIAVIAGDDTGEPADLSAA